MMAFALIKELRPRKMKLWMKIQFNEKILPLVVLGLNIAWTILIALLLSGLTYYQFGVSPSPGGEVSLPIHLMYLTIDEGKAYGQHSFRESSLLQGTFDLLSSSISSKQSLQFGLEYEIKFSLEVPENEKSENEGMFAVCISGIPGLLHDSKYGQCRTAVLVKQNSLFSSILELFYKCPTNTKQLHLILEDHFVPDLYEKSVHGTITLLSYNLQVIESKLTFKPVISAYAFPLSVILSILLWWFIFILWLIVIAIYRINNGT